MVDIVFGMFLYGLHLGNLEPVQKTLTSELADKDYVASSLGGFQIIVGLTALPASLLAGFLWDKFSPAAPFYFSIVLTFVAISILLFVK